MIQFQTFLSQYRGGYEFCCVVLGSGFTQDEILQYDMKIIVLN
jgi:hypothetical protein